MIPALAATVQTSWTAAYADGGRGTGLDVRRAIVLRIVSAVIWLGVTITTTEMATKAARLPSTIAALAVAIRESTRRARPSPPS